MTLSVKLKVVFLLCLLATAPVSAQFELNFQSHSSHEGDAGVRREITTTPLHQINGTSYEFQSGQTPFLTEFGWNTDTGEEWQAPEIVTLNIEGTDRTFYHMVMGDMATGFIQETYIEMGYAMTSSGGGFINGNQPAQLGVSSNYASASAGNYVVTRSAGKVVNPGNAADPLGDAASSGSGTANPNRVVVLQLNNDGELFSEFRKDSLLGKPVINQNMGRFGEIQTSFSMDMSNSTYDDMGTAGVMTNTIQLFGAGVPETQIGKPDGANFNVVAESQTLDVTGGRYTYTPGSGGLSVDHPGGSAGTYTYYDSAIDQTTIPWDQYFDANDPTGNPWSYTDGRP